MEGVAYGSRELNTIDTRALNVVAEMSSRWGWQSSPDLRRPADRSGGTWRGPNDRSGGAESARDSAKGDEMGRDPRDGLVDRLSTILEEAGIFINADLSENTLSLVGEVDSSEDRQAAIDVATALSATVGVIVDNRISILDLAANEASEEEEMLSLAEPPLDGLQDRV